MSGHEHEDDLEPEWDPSVHRLPVWATIGEALQTIAKEWKALLQVRSSSRGCADSDGAVP